MGFRENLLCDPSVAEIQLLCALKADKEIGRYIFFHNGGDPISLGIRNGRKWETTPDFTYLSLSPFKFVPIYLDGPAHLKLNRERKDHAIDEALTEMGLHPFRLPYNGRPLSNWKQKKFVREIKEVCMRD